MTVSGSGTVTFTHTDTYDGPTSVSGGTLVAAATDALGSEAATVTLAAGTTLVLDSQNQNNNWQDYDNALLVTGNATVDVENYGAAFWQLDLGPYTLNVISSSGQALVLGGQIQQGGWYDYLADNATIAPAAGVTVYLQGEESEEGTLILARTKTPDRF